MLWYVWTSSDSLCSLGGACRHSVTDGRARRRAWSARGNSAMTASAPTPRSAEMREGRDVCEIVIDSFSPGDGLNPSDWPGRSYKYTANRLAALSC